MSGLHRRRTTQQGIQETVMLGTLERALASATATEPARSAGTLCRRIFFVIITGARGVL